MNPLAVSTDLQASLSTLLTDGLARLHLVLEQRQIEQLIRYLNLIVKWNRVHNLTAIRDPLSMVSLHILDSLATARFLKVGSILDVGTGAGLPGIPLAIVNPDSKVTLIDTSSKKTAFLTQAISELRLDNVVVVNARVQQWHGGPFDAIVSRAFSELRDFVAVSHHLLGPEGLFVAMKGVHPRVEIDELPQAYVVKKVEALEVPGVNAERHLVMIGKA